MKRLSWGHICEIFSEMSSFREAKIFADVILYTEDTPNPVYAHSIVLASLRLVLISNSALLKLGKSKDLTTLLQIHSQSSSVYIFRAIGCKLGM